MCFEAGLVRGEELFFDSTKVKANADIDSLASRFLVETHLSRLFEGSSTPEEGGGPSPDRRKYWKACAKVPVSTVSKRAEAVEKVVIRAVDSPKQNRNT